MSREVKKKVTSEEKMESMLDCIYTPKNQCDVPWYRMSDYISFKLRPFLKLMNELKLLTEGEIVIKDEKGKYATYKG